MLMGTHRLAASDGYAGELQRDIDRLVLLKDRNSSLKDLSDHEGWCEVEEDLSLRALNKLKELPDLVTRGEWEKATEYASYIRFANQVLGLVNEPLLESARVEMLINSKLSMQRRFEEEQRVTEQGVAEGVI
jgi:hypothetical protein